MSITRIASGGPYEAKIGYCRSVVANGFVFVSGCTGEGADVVAQCRSAVARIEQALAEAGAAMSDVVRVTYMLPDHREFESCWPVLSEAFGANPPAATMIECGLIAPQFRIEIEVTAVVPGAA